METDHFCRRSLIALDCRLGRHGASSTWKSKVLACSSDILGLLFSIIIACFYIHIYIQIVEGKNDYHIKLDRAEVVCHTFIIINAVTICKFDIAPIPRFRVPSGDKHKRVNP